MPAAFHRPVRMPAEHFDFVQGGEDPALIARTAHETAAALVARVRSNPDPAVVDRLVAFAQDEGIDAVADLWSRARPNSLPGALWRIYLLREMIRQDSAGTALLFERGAARLQSIDPVVAGAPDPAGPDELLRVADEILRGVFVGDLGLALDRAAAFCRVVADGAVDAALDLGDASPDRAGDLTRRSARLSGMAVELSTAARLWRDGALD